MEWSRISILRQYYRQQCYPRHSYWPRNDNPSLPVRCASHVIRRTYRIEVSMTNHADRPKSEDKMGLCSWLSSGRCLLFFGCTVMYKRFGWKCISDRVCLLRTCVVSVSCLSGFLGMVSMWWSTRLQVIRLFSVAVSMSFTCLIGKMCISAIPYTSWMGNLSYAIQGHIWSMDKTISHC